jgi:hypothetical protein
MRLKLKQTKSQTEPVFRMVNEKGATNYTVLCGTDTIEM